MLSTIPPKITLYVDIVSPFAYMAYYILRHHPAFQKCEITFVPIFLGGVMKACGNTPPIKIKNKDQWLHREIKTWASLLSIPWSTPPSPTYPPDFPPLTLAPQRALCALAAQAPATLPAALDALFHAYWVEQRATHTPEVVAAVLAATEAVGPEATAAATATEQGRALGKEALSRNTEEALAAGAFGLPWFVCVDGEGRSRSFWGVDRLGFVAAFLGLEGGPRLEGGEWLRGRL